MLRQVCPPNGGSRKTTTARGIYPHIQSPILSNAGQKRKLFGHEDWVIGRKIEVSRPFERFAIATDGLSMRIGGYSAVFIAIYPDLCVNARAQIRPTFAWQGGQMPPARPP
ncbi:hypothetical protein B7486_11730 [cyanobacterium TDX16]|nr:hypothetical protein B7486_11730 [cyanobacterium TDX16]